MTFRISGGGADGSIVAFGQTELAYQANGGLDDVVNAQASVFARSNLSAGDLLVLFLYSTMEQPFIVGSHF